MARSCSFVLTQIPQGGHEVGLVVQHPQKVCQSVHSWIEGRSVANDHMGCNKQRCVPKQRVWEVVRPPLSPKDVANQLAYR